VMSTERIVVGIDGAPSGAQALSWASAEADRKRRAGDRARQRCRQTIGGVLGAGHDVDYGRRRLRSRTVDRRRRGRAASQPTVEVTTVLRVADPAELLIELGTPATLLVVGTNGEGRFIGALLGSVSHRVAAHARCPVVVIPHDASSIPRSRRIVVGVIAASAGHQTLRFGFEEAAERRASLVAVCAYGTFSRSARDPILDQSGGVRHHEQQELLDALARLQDEFPTVAVEARLVDEPVIGASTRASVGAELLVVGCRDDDAHRSSRLCPLAAQLLHTSPCPVAIVGLPQIASVMVS
jgi:nucleotide-binding universal stress UspA family protein